MYNQKLKHLDNALMLLNVKFKVLERWQFSFDLQQIEENMDRFEGLQLWL